MFYNAMRKKGWDPREEDMETVVAIHNNVNEKTWRKVLAWESLHPQYAHQSFKGVALMSAMNGQ
jgi:cytochrome c heme-lyase